MYRKSIVFVVIFILIFTTAAYASSFIPEGDTSSFGINFSKTAPEAVDDGIMDYTKKGYIPDDHDGGLQYISFLRPEEFADVFDISRDYFSFSCRAAEEFLIIRLLVYDSEKGIYVPVTRETTDVATGEKKVTEQAWKFGVSGYLLCSFRLPSEKLYEYRLLIHKAGLEAADYVLDKNLQVLDFSVNFKKPVSFEDILVNSFWDIYFDTTKYALPILP